MQFRAQEKIEEKSQWDPKFAYEHLLSMSVRGGASPLQFTERQKCVVDDPCSFLSTEDLNLWNLEDIAKAGKKLRIPPLPCEFEDEQEMRRVYSLIYDVYRCEYIYTLFYFIIYFYFISLFYFHSITIFYVIPKHFM